MRSRFPRIAVTVLAVVALSTLLVAGEKAWLDWNNCDMCRNFMENPELLPNMAWEQHKIGSGFISVSTVKKELAPAYHKANEKCTALGQKIAAGETANLCGMCEAMGGLMMKGAQMEQVPLQNGGVMLMTSADPKVVAELYAFVDRNNAEMQKMSAKPEEAKKK